LLAGLASLIIAFLVGFVPQFLKAAELRKELQARDQRIEQFEREAKIATARDHASLLYLELTRKNYGIAGQHATQFFNHVRAMLNSTSDPAYKAALESAMSNRDAIVASIAKPDSAVEGQVRDILDRLHQLAAPGIKP
jgi:hypothetical protein